MKEISNLMINNIPNRSFENGKVDLTQVEGLGDLLNAENEMQRKQALKLMEGHSKDLYIKWSDELLKVCYFGVFAYLNTIISLSCTIFWAHIFLYYF